MDLDEALRTPGPQRRNNAWMCEQRVCMQMIWTNRSVKRNERARIFNEIFKDYGLPDSGVKLNAMEVEYAKRKNTSSSSGRRWQKVFYPPQTIKDDRMRARLQASIEALTLPDSEPDTIQVAVPASPEDSEFDTIHLAVPASPLGLVSKDAQSKQTTYKCDPTFGKRSVAAHYPPVTTKQGGYQSDQVRGRKRRRQNSERQDSPIVSIPRVSDALLSCRTPAIGALPKSGDHTPRSCDLSVEIIPYPRMGNDPVMLSATMYRNVPPAGAAYIDVSESDAHPKRPALLWRYWDSMSHGTNSTNGFKSGRSTHARAPPRGPPLCKDLEWTDVLEHLNPNQRLDNPTPSPFISTSSRLIWIIRLALRRQNPSSRISVINSAVLDPMAIYYVPPFHTELKKHLAFDYGAQYYKGISEHLVWNQIPQDAITNTFTVSDLCELAERNPGVKRVLRLNKVGAKGRLDIITRSLKSDNVKITDKKAVAMPVLVKFFGLDHTSSHATLSRMVYEIAQGWALTPDSVTESSWQAKARWFTHTICRKSCEPVSFADQSKIYHAFLDGLKWSRGDVNVRFKGQCAYDMMQRRAAKLALGRPAQLITDELKASMRRIQRYSEEQHDGRTIGYVVLPSTPASSEAASAIEE